jgi:hypothetical protein
VEVFPPKGELWDVHRERFEAVVSEFLNQGMTERRMTGVSGFLPDHF